MQSKLKNILFLLIITLVPTLLIWLPFFFKLESFWNIPLPQAGMATIVSNFDGPLYLVIAKTFYNTDIIRLNYSFPLPLEYYAAHFPLFPLLIRVFAVVAGFPYSMLFVTIASAFALIYYFHKFIAGYVGEKNAMWTTFVFSIFPARLLISRSVGSAEPLFMAAILASIYYFKNKKYLLAGIFGAIAQLTKSPGILLFLAYLGAIIAPHAKRYALVPFAKWVRLLNIRKKLPLLLIPLSLILVFSIYQYTYGNFLAYFNSGDNIHLFFPPFQIFNYSSPWVGTFWLEEVLFVYLLAGLGLMKLIGKKETVLAWFVGIYFVSIIFVSHRDLIRYSLPIVPFLYAAFSDIVVKREFKIVLAILVIPIYLYSLSFISQNVMPISDWRPFL